MRRTFLRSRAATNGLNLRLHHELLVYEELVLDMKKPSRMRRIALPEDGFVISVYRVKADSVSDIQ